MGSGSRAQRGAAMAEYGLLVALIAVVCIGAVTALGIALSGRLGEAAGDMPPAPTFTQDSFIIMDGDPVNTILAMKALVDATENCPEVEVIIIQKVE